MRYFALCVGGYRNECSAHIPPSTHHENGAEKTRAQSTQITVVSVCPPCRNTVPGSESRVKTRLHLTRCSLYCKRPYQDSGLLDKSMSSARLAAGCNSDVHNSLRTASLWKHTYSRALALRRPRLVGLGPALTLGSVTMFSRHCRRCTSRLTW